MSDEGECEGGREGGHDHDIGGWAQLLKQRTRLSIRMLYPSLIWIPDLSVIDSTCLDR